jgi:hypothetical protein
MTAVTCTLCGGQFECTGHTAPLDGVVQPCPLKKGAIWAQVQDDAGNPVAGVTVGAAGASKPSDDVGYAAFDPLDAKTYQVKIGDLKGKLADRYEPPAPAEKPVVVAAGKIAAPAFVLKRRARLTVKVFQKAKASRLFEKAKVTVTGPGSPPAQQTTSGVADFGWLKADDYKVKVELDPEDAKTFGLATQTYDVKLKPTADFSAVEVPVEVEPICAVTPKVEAEFLVALIDPDLAKHQGSEPKKITVDATRVELSLAHTAPEKPYPKAKAIKLKCAPASVEAFLDEACSDGKKLAGDLAAGVPLGDAEKEELVAGRKVKVYLRGKTAGAFKVSLDLEASGDPFVKLAPAPPALDMAAMRLEMKVCWQDQTEIAKLEVDPDADPPPLTGNEDYDPFATTPKVPKPEKYHENLMKQYWKALNDKALPAQKEMTDEEKVKLDPAQGKLGRLLHVQTDKSAGRAKLLVKKIEASKWPAGTDDYELYLNLTKTSGDVTVYDAEVDGTAKSFPLKIARSEIATADKVLWIEGKTETAKAGAVVLDLTLDRAEGGLSKDPKRNADWARFTVVTIKDVKVDYTTPTDEDTAWDDTNEKFYINLKTDDDKARTVTIGAQLGKEIEGVVVHFMLAPDKDNQKTANWGVDLPKGGMVGPKKGVAATITGGDTGSFQLTGTTLTLDAGVIDADVKDTYSVEVSQPYDSVDGFAAPTLTITYEIDVTDMDGDDTTGGVPARECVFPEFKLPTWKWNKIDATVKHVDKADRKKLLHLSAKTNDKGYAKVDLKLSRFGGDKFRPACYIAEDPHLAKYVHGHADLEKRKPVLAAKAINVWRRMWYQRVVVAGLTPREFTDAAGQYTRVKAEMKQATDLTVLRATVNGYSPQAIYPKYMVQVNGGTNEILLVSDTNKGQFFSGFTAAKDKPNMIPILVCDAQWDPTKQESARSFSKLRTSRFPLAVDVGKKVLSPPLQGAGLALLVSGKWRAAEKNGASWANDRNGDLLATDIEIDPSRDSLQKIKVKLPSGVGATTAKTRVWLTNLVVHCANSYLGESFQKRILAVYEPSNPEDFQNTIVHELGHAYSQVIQNDPAGGVTGIPAHPAQLDAAHQGNHCRVLVNKCVMYDSGLPAGQSDNRYCDVCHAYLLVQDMKTIT